VERGAKKKAAKNTDKAIADTILGFAYSFPGSVGVMMTIANDRHLFGAKLDEAMEKTLQLIRAQESEELLSLADKVGLPALRLVHQWTEENVKAGFGADIVWQRDDIVGKEVRVQLPELAVKAALLNSMRAEETIVVVGELLDVKVSDHTFSMQLSDRIIQGSFDKVISSQHPVQLPKTYQATLKILQKVVVDDTGQEEIEYFHSETGILFPPKCTKVNLWYLDHAPSAGDGVSTGSRRNIAVPLSVHLWTDSGYDQLLSLQGTRALRGGSATSKPSGRHRTAVQQPVEAAQRQRLWFDRATSRA
jgi:hypothetical protein